MTPQMQQWQLKIPHLMTGAPAATTSTTSTRPRTVLRPVQSVQQSSAAVSRKGKRSIVQNARNAQEKARNAQEKARNAQEKAQEKAVIVNPLKPLKPRSTRRAGLNKYRSTRKNRY
jgi:hypothetical protein